MRNQNVFKLFPEIEIPADPVTAARGNLSRSILELIRAAIETGDVDAMILGQDLSVVLNEWGH